MRFSQRQQRSSTTRYEYTNDIFCIQNWFKFSTTTFYMQHSKLIVLFFSNFMNIQMQYVRELGKVLKKPRAVNWIIPIYKQ